MFFSDLIKLMKELADLLLLEQRGPKSLERLMVILQLHCIYINDQSRLEKLRNALLLVNHYAWHGIGLLRNYSDLLLIILQEYKIDADIQGLCLLIISKITLNCITVDNIVQIQNKKIIYSSREPL